MKKIKNLSIQTIVFSALVLMVVSMVVARQLFNNKSISTLKKANTETINTYQLNNRMQRVLALSYDLQAKLSNTASGFDFARINQLRDSINMLGSNSEILKTAFIRLGYKKQANDLYSIITDQLEQSISIIVSAQADNLVRRDSLITQLGQTKPADVIYAQCVELQKLLGERLENIVNNNSKIIEKLVTYSRVLGVIIIITILGLARLIIKKRARRLKLIRELRTAEIAAVKSKKVKDDFVANMSHELRTPLNALIGFSNLLNQTELKENQQEYVDIISAGGQNLLNIVNDLLDLSKMEAGKLRLRSKPFNIRTVLESTKKLFSASLADKRLAFEWFVDKKIPQSLKGDSDRLMQILINLIGNAIKFTTVGGIHVNVGIVWVDEASRIYKLAITVKDSGSGIPAEKVQTIFERFEQLEHVSTRQHGGTGLGLTIVKNLVEKMGGAVSVYSEVGVGSEFTFTCMFEELPELEEAEEKKSIHSFSLDGYKILAAEDNGANQMLLKHLLAKYQASLIIVDNGQEVLDLLEKNHYDLVLMDIQMPIMDGYTAVKYIRDELKSDRKIIAMTAYVSEEEIEKCLCSGFDDYIAKPIDEADFILKISKHLQQKPLLIKPEEHDNNSDLHFLKELVGNDPEAIAEIIHEMKAQWRIDRSELIIAARSSNLVELRRILHRIKSTLSPLGPVHSLYVDASDKNHDVMNDDFTINVSEYEEFIDKVDTFIITL